MSEIHDRIRKIVDEHSTALLDELRNSNLPATGCLLAVVWNPNENEFDGGFTVKAVTDGEEHQILHDVETMIHTAIERDHQHPGGKH